MPAEKKYTLVIHGGVGTILRSNMTPEKEKAYLKTMGEALTAGEAVLAGSGTAISAVEAAVRVLEDSPLFNAGRGSVFTNDGKNEMDASIMDGRDLGAGAVAGITCVRNPVSAALEVMRNSGHVMLIGQGAEEFARQHGCEMVEPSWFYDEERFRQLEHARKNDSVLLDHSGENEASEKENSNEEKKLGTVGAVALDVHGNLAAATSTGGMTNKKYGRVGDSPVIGAGTYANNSTCAISCTGHGEYFIKNVVAYDISALMDYRGLSLKEAADLVILNKLQGQNAEGGLIGVDNEGNFVTTFNTEGMYRGVVTYGKAQVLKIFS